MEQFEIKITTTHDLAETVSAILFSVGAAGVSIIDKADVVDALTNGTSWDYVDDSVLNEPDNRAVLTTVIEGEPAEFLSRFDQMKELLLPNVKFDVTTKKLENLDWSTEWRKHYKPIVTKSITVVPSWIDYLPKNGEKTIKLEPGMAFGTGEHATTRMCLDLTPSLVGKKVIDVGCGSGILGISASILGAKSVYMCDLDSQCIEAATLNAKFNDVDVKIEQSDLLAKTGEIGDVVFANLTADILLRLAEGIGKHIAKGGVLIMSGIIDSREAEVIDKYLSLGFTVDERREEGDWRAFRLIWN